MYTITHRCKAGRSDRVKPTSDATVHRNDEAAAAKQTRDTARLWTPIRGNPATDLLGKALRIWLQSVEKARSEMSLESQPASHLASAITVERFMVLSSVMVEAWRYSSV